MDNRPIGVFDSGVGGITVVKEIISAMQKENIVYFGDTKRVPYGDKTKEQLFAFSKQIIDYLISKECKIIVIACNTISSNCLEDLKREYNDIDIVDVVTASVDEAVITAKENICVFATKGTVKSRIHETCIKKIRPEVNIYNKACPLLVHVVEEGFIDSEIPFLAVKEYCKDYLDADTYILGCTHYPIILDAFQKVVGLDKNIIDPAKGTAMKVKDILEKKSMLGSNNVSKYDFYYSGESDNFTATVKNILDSVSGRIFTGEITL